MFDTVYDNMNNVVLLQHDFFTFLRALIFLGARGGRKTQTKIQKKIHTISWQRKRKKDDHIHREGGKRDG